MFRAPERRPLFGRPGGVSICSGYYDVLKGFLPAISSKASP
jgi:hypothetical protein